MDSAILTLEWDLVCPENGGCISIGNLDKLEGLLKSDKREITLKFINRACSILEEIAETGTLACDEIELVNKKRIDETGKRYNMLTVLEYVGYTNVDTIWKCRCDCGTIKEIKRRGLVDGSTKSCGCMKSLMIAVTKRNKAINSGKFIGVGSVRDKYEARFMGNILGKFEKDIDAAKAYDKVAFKHYKDASVCNFPEDYL